MTAASGPPARIRTVRYTGAGSCASQARIGVAIVVPPCTSLYCSLARARRSRLDGQLAVPDVQRQHCSRVRRMSGSLVSCAARSAGTIEFCMKASTSRAVLVAALCSAGYLMFSGTSSWFRSQTISRASVANLHAPPTHGHCLISILHVRSFKLYRCSSHVAHLIVHVRQTRFQIPTSMRSHPCATSGAHHLRTLASKQTSSECPDRRKHAVLAMLQSLGV